MVVRDDEALVELANDSPFDLGGSIFSNDVARAKALASRIETGMVWINGRELAESGLKELVNQKLAVVAPARTSPVPERSRSPSGVSRRDR